MQRSRGVWSVVFSDRLFCTSVGRCYLFKDFFASLLTYASVRICRVEFFVKVLVTNKDNVSDKTSRDVLVLSLTFLCSIFLFEKAYA